MAETAARSTRSRTTNRRRKVADDDVGAQVERLQDDLNATVAALARLSGRKADEIKGEAQDRYADLLESGHKAVADAQEQVSELESQLKKAIRDKPLTFVAGAAAVGFIIALLTR